MRGQASEKAADKRREKLMMTTDKEAKSSKS
jgi:hypothetical protein